VGLDAGARARPPARRRTAAGDLRSLRLGRLDLHHRRHRRLRHLGDPRRRGRAGALVPDARPAGPAAAHDRLRRRRRNRQRGGGRRGWRAVMNRCAALLDRLAYEPGRNAKLRLLTEYFRTTPDPERGYALAAITGALSFRHAKPGLIRTLIAER